MKKSYPIIQPFCYFLFLSTMVYAQTVPDTAFVARSIEVARNVHIEKTKKQSPLYNGTQYSIYNPTEEEHPYFLSDDWIDGTIVYSGEQFDNISLMYDISLDKVIAEHFAGAALEMITAKVTTFTLNGHVFRRFKKSDDQRQSIKDGFYEVLYDGQTKILKRHVKVFTQMIRDRAVVNDYEEKRYFYVVKNNAFYQVSSRGSLIKILSDRKRELRRYSRENRLPGGKNDDTLIKLAAYYDTLNP